MQDAISQPPKAKAPMWALWRSDKHLLSDLSITLIEANAMGAQITHKSTQRDIKPHGQKQPERGKEWIDPRYHQHARPIAQRYVCKRICNALGQRCQPDIPNHLPQIENRRGDANECTLQPICIALNLDLVNFRKPHDCCRCCQLFVPPLFVLGIALPDW